MSEVSSYLLCFYVTVWEVLVVWALRCQPVVSHTKWQSHVCVFYFSFFVPLWWWQRNHEHFKRH